MENSSPTPDLAALRREYGDAGLDLADLERDPITMFRRWLEETIESRLHEPNAMALSTVSRSGTPSSRMVLLKALDERGFVFYTNLDSRKGVELADNPRCALLFPWHALQRQVRVEGVAERVPTQEAEEYFASRPRPSQIGAWASQQSRAVPTRSDLDEHYRAAQQRFEDGEEVPLPPNWGGFRVRPGEVEFWQGRVGRMHDRLVYRHVGLGEEWTVERLAP